MGTCTPAPACKSDGAGQKHTQSRLVDQRMCFPPLSLECSPVPSGSQPSPKRKIASYTRRGVRRSVGDCELFPPAGTDNVAFRLPAGLQPSDFSDAQQMHRCATNQRGGIIQALLRADFGGMDDHVIERSLPRASAMCRCAADLCLRSPARSSSLELRMTGIVNSRDRTFMPAGQ